ncbi:hypothetical protein HYT23_05205 [Candidatus Pacearchaeota archaeon]|nr:hypothetical protein [Candidatus Pacearchaeota archaeon]
MEDIEKKIKSLSKGDRIYLHPRSKKELAHFGKYQGNRYSESLKEDGILLALALSFSYEKLFGTNLWIPDRSLARITLIYPISYIRKEKILLYVGEDIGEGMRKNDNYYNYSLVSEIMKQ